MLAQTQDGTKLAPWGFPMLHIEETHSKIFLIEMSILCLGNFCLLFVTPCTEVVLLLCQTYFKISLILLDHGVNIDQRKLIIELGTSAMICIH